MVNTTVTLTARPQIVFNNALNVNPSLAFHLVKATNAELLLRD
jgi:hypothetical protein